MLNFELKTRIFLFFEDDYVKEILTSDSDIRLNFLCVQVPALTLGLQYLNKGNDLISTVRNVN